MIASPKAPTRVATSPTGSVGSSSCFLPGLPVTTVTTSSGGGAGATQMSTVESPTLPFTNGIAALPAPSLTTDTVTDRMKDNIKPSPMDNISPWLVSSDVVTGPTKPKEATIIRKSVITTQL
uniref:Uncharacterized protein n=1 Tax=Anopheles maculatus TaxID=74869 RepID=A0A182SAN2_9DIPT